MKSGTPRYMLIGEYHVGKSSLIRLLSRSSYRARKVLALDFWRNFINTPSEFLENRRFYSALITAAADCHTLIFVQDATRKSCQIPPGFAAMFNRRVLGVITKTDLPEASAERAARFLKNAGVHDMLEVSLKTGKGITRLRELLHLEEQE